MITTDHIKINWEREQSNLFGLNYVSKFGSFANYKFDIRYDYDGEPNKKPNCGVWLNIYATHPVQGKRWPRQVPLEDFSCFNIDSAVSIAEKWLKREADKFINTSQNKN